MNTLWESICLLAGEDATAPISLAEAIRHSAVPAAVAKVEVKRFANDGLLVQQDDVLTLTDRGRKDCLAMNRVTAEHAIVAPE